MSDVYVIVTPAGVVRLLHDDRMAGLYADGGTRLRRVSHVEPTTDGRWTADMAPVGGPVLGPFALRGDALTAEREWLDERLTTINASSTTEA